MEPKPIVEFHQFLGILLMNSYWFDFYFSDVTTRMIIVVCAGCSLNLLTVWLLSSRWQIINIYS